VKYVQVLLLIFCLGIFLIPKDNFYAQASQENCCKSDSKKDNCCTKTHDNHQKSNDHKGKSCKDDCGSFCMTCHSFIENLSAKSVFIDHSLFATDRNLQFHYSDPYISNHLKDIWQPPKLG